MSRETLRISAIRRDGGTQPRAGIDKATVVEYAERMKAGDQFPVPLVVHDGSQYWLLDGYHRIAAVVALGFEEADVEVMQGTHEEAVWLSCSVNKSHGLKRTNNDKRRSVERALRSRPETSDRAIAEHCGVSHVFVAKVRSEVVTVSTWTPNPAESNEPERRTGKDGKSYAAKKTTKKATKKPAPPPEPDDDDEPKAPPAAPPPVTLPPGVHPVPKAPEPEPAPLEYKPTPPPQGMPEHLVKRRATNHKAILPIRIRAQNMLKEAAQAKASLTRLMNEWEGRADEAALVLDLKRLVGLSTLITDANQAAFNLQASCARAQIDVVCRHCKGAGCVACDNRGLISDVLARAHQENGRK